MGLKIPVSKQSPERIVVTVIAPGLGYIFKFARSEPFRPGNKIV
jgi:hypothetical protein